jgi:hypothetical protein
MVEKPASRGLFLFGKIPLTPFIRREYNYSPHLVCIFPLFVYHFSMLLSKSLLHTTDVYIKKLKEAGIETVRDFI